jgi:hypothetical protein
MGSGFGPEHAWAGRPPAARRDPVVLVQDASTNPEIVLSKDRLGASYGAFQKSAVRSNQAMIGEFRYFEAHREVGPVNIGQGLINPFADIDPYCCVSNDPHNAPPSMSMNSGGGIWQNLVYQTGFPSANTTYGFAVDYRGARPIVHCIVGDQLITSLTLSDLFTPIVPMLYGDPAGPVLVNTVNFGTKPFRYDPEVILSGAGVDATALVRGWGDANRPAANPNVLSHVSITSAPASVRIGQAVSATAAATDVDQADASAFVEWSDGDEDDRPRSQRRLRPAPARPARPARELHRQPRRDERGLPRGARPAPPGGAALSPRAGSGAAADQEQDQQHGDRNPEQPQEKPTRLALLRVVPVRPEIVHRPSPFVRCAGLDRAGDPLPSAGPSIARRGSG